MSVKEFVRKNIIPYVIGIICLIFTLLMSYARFMKNFENFLIDQRFFVKRPASRDRIVQRGALQQGTAISVGKKVKSPIMIFGIDEKSLNEIGRWPWPRSIHKTFLDFFYSSPNYDNKPYAVFYDLFFDKYKSLILKKKNVELVNKFIKQYMNARTIGNLSSEISIRQNQLIQVKAKKIISDLSQSLRETIDDPVFFHKIEQIFNYTQTIQNNETRRGGYLFFDFQATGQILGRFSEEIVSRRLKYMKPYFLKISNPDKIGKLRRRMIRDMKAPVKEILSSSNGAGAAMIYADSDGVVRKMPMLYMFYDDRLYTTATGQKKKVMDKPVFIATIDLIIAMNYYQVKSEQVEVVLGKHIILKNAKVPMFKQNIQDFGGIKITKGWKIEGYKTQDVFIPINDYGEMLINFQGPHKSFDNQPYFEGVNMQKHGNFDNRVNYNNRIILVGFYTSAGLGEGKDYFTTPYNILYGIEIHANALHTIFNQNYIYHLNPTMHWLILILLILIFAYALPRISIFWGFITFIVIEVLIFTGGLLAFKYSSTLIQMVTLIVFTLLQFIATTVYRLLTEEKEKRKIRGMFAQYVNPEVVTELIQDPDKIQLGGEDRDLTVLFSDIRGFTTISEKLSPQELVALLNEYLSDMTDILFEYSGTLDKYIGDAVMAFWGAPIPLEHHAHLAADAALVMMDKVRALNNKMKNDPQFSEKGISMDIGIGLNSGNMTVGNMGSQVRKNYTIMGDNVNLGSRLEGVNKVYSTNIIISENTYELIKDHFIVRELDLIRVKGKYEPVRIFELVGRKDGVTSDTIKALEPVLTEKKDKETEKTK